MPNSGKRHSCVWVKIESKYNSVFAQVLFLLFPSEAWLLSVCVLKILAIFILSGDILDMSTGFHGFILLTRLSFVFVVVCVLPLTYL
jgi:hypothetical protein